MKVRTSSEYIVQLWSGAGLGRTGKERTLALVVAGKDM